MGDIHFSSVTCSGNENKITDCSYRTDETVNHQHDVQVQCQQGRVWRIFTLFELSFFQVWMKNMEIFN